MQMLLENVSSVAKCLATEIVYSKQKTFCNENYNFYWKIQLGASLFHSVCSLCFHLVFNLVRRNEYNPDNQHTTTN